MKGPKNITHYKQTAAIIHLNPTMLTLKIIIKKEWFDQIAAGTKKIEYRDVVPFWTSRLFNTEGKRKKYDRIEFINGYNKNARRLITSFEGLTTKNNTYCIKIGKIIK